MKPSARCKRLEFVWHERSWNMLGGRSYVWIWSIWATRNGESSLRGWLFDPMSCLLVLMKSTLSMNGDFHSVQHLQLSEPSSVDTFWHRYLLLASVHTGTQCPNNVCLQYGQQSSLKGEPRRGDNSSVDDGSPSSPRCERRTEFEAGGRKHAI